MKITITIKKDELDALRFCSIYNDGCGSAINKLLEKIEKQIKYNKEKNVYDKQVKDIMEDVVDAIGKHKFIIGED